MGLFDKIKEKIKGKPTNSMLTQADGTKDYNKLPLIANGSYMKYNYERSIYFIDPQDFNKVIGNGGLQVTFSFEPENEYDNKAIKIVTLDDEFIGYVKKGNVQDMIHDWDAKGWGIAAHLNKYSIDDKTATYKIGFYRPLKGFEHKEFKITKITKKHDEFGFSSRFENFEYCSIGDGVTFVYDKSTDSYIVYNELKSEIGEMPKSFNKFVENAEEFIGVITDIDTYDTLKAYVDVYIVKREH